MKIQIYILGSGRAALALERSLMILKTLEPSFEIENILALKRGASLKGLKKNDSKTVLFIANPHALHAAKIIEADQEGFDLVVSEKPAGVSLEDIELLKKVKTRVALCHVYRQSWGIQTLRSMIKAGDFGNLFAIEGRYWQSSTAFRALADKSKFPTQNWKNDISLSGPYDTLIDIVTHWADAALFLNGETPSKTKLWLSYVNAEEKHRDSHVHLTMSFPNKVRALSSISKTMHGASNHFEVNVLGSKKSATWKFLEPDQIEIGEGNLRRIMVRSDTTRGSRQSTYHGLGWLEGYVEILFQSFKHMMGMEYEEYPDLKSQILMLESLLGAERE